jgi:hypothetical protein
MASAFDGTTVVPLKHLLLSALPRDMADFINTHILHPHSPFQTYKRALLAQAQRAVDALSPLAQPLADRLLALVAENQGAVGILISVVVLTVLVFVVTLVQRVMVWCTRVAMRIVFWGCVCGVAAWAWQRGPLETARDAVVVGSKVAGFLAGLGNYWLEEYNRYDEQEKMHTRRAARTTGRRGR